MTAMRFRGFHAVGFWLLVCFAQAAAAHAGQLVITNGSPKPLTCTVDGFPKPMVIPAAVTVRRFPNPTLATPVINWVQCGKLRTRMMNITPAGPDGILVFTGEQTRTLNVLLYPYIPTLAQSGFISLVAYIVDTYQAQNPQVLLNAVMNPDIDTYDFAVLKTVVGRGGYDVLELDMSFLGFLVANNLIVPVNIRGDKPWPVALQTATFNNQLYGIPSWLCTDFVYFLENDPKARRSLKELRSKLPGTPRLLVSDLDGSWELPALYLNTYVQTYGYTNINNAFTTPIDSSVVQQVSGFASMCSGDDGNPCIDGRYHDAADGTVEKVFATGNAWLTLGFSERSFFISLYQSAPGYLTAGPMSWASTYPSTLLMYTDAFVTNRSTCMTGYCPGDSQAFTTLMTGSAMKSMIAFSKDLPQGAPPRHLLVATQPFWSLSAVQNDPLYQQFSTIFSAADYQMQPFPNWFTAASKQTMSGGVCDQLKAIFPSYACTGTTEVTAR